MYHIAKVNVVEALCGTGWLLVWDRQTGVGKYEFKRDIDITEGQDTRACSAFPLYHSI